jgi:hypothetical protein
LTHVTQIGVWFQLLLALGDKEMLLFCSQQAHTKLWAKRKDKASSNTVVRSSNHDPEIEGLIPAVPGTGRETKWFNTVLNKRTHNYEEEEKSKPGPVAYW